MYKCRVYFQLPGKIEFQLQSGEEETAEELVESLASGRAPTWLETLVMDSLSLENIEIESIKIRGHEPELGEELDLSEF
jgi:hypothetical protein